jgi:hypothetical protein
MTISSLPFIIRSLKRIIKETPQFVKHKINGSYGEHEVLLEELNQFFDYGESLALRDSLCQDSKSSCSSLSAISTSEDSQSSMSSNLTGTFIRNGIYLK